MKIKALKRKGYSYSELSERFGLHINTIVRICKEKQWKS